MAPAPQVVVEMEEAGGHRARGRVEWERGWCLVAGDVLPGGVGAGQNIWLLAGWIGAVTGVGQTSRRSP